jgi:aminoglycoside phosphotransferase (APT) family kinase protein
MGARLHPAEVDADAELVRRLVRAQHPRWGDLPLVPVDSTGTVHVLYRLGDDLVVRLPRRPSDCGELAKERRWLPVLARHLPVAVPEPVAHGEPGEGYPLSWAVYRWLDGEHPDPAALRDAEGLALDLAAVVVAMRAVPTAGAPRAFRSERLGSRDEATLASLEQAQDLLDAEALAALWAELVDRARRPSSFPWQHGDLLPANLLVDAAGRLTAAIDLGCAGTGDAAVDLLPAWAVLTGAARARFRDAVDVDEATWDRGRAWALSIAALQTPYYRDTNPRLAAVGVRVLRELLLDASN